MSVGKKRATAAEDRTPSRTPEPAERKVPDARAAKRSQGPIQYKLPAHLESERGTPIAGSRPSPTANDLRPFRSLASASPQARSGNRYATTAAPTTAAPTTASPTTASPTTRAASDAGEPAIEADDGELDYTPMVYAALQVSVLMFFTQLLSSVLIANFQGGIIRVAFWFEIVPYLQIWTDATSYVTIITWSTMIAVGVTCAGVLRALWRLRDVPLLVDGWGAGLPMAALLLVIQVIRHHYRQYEVIDTWVVTQAAAVLLATSMVFLGFRPGGVHSVTGGRKGAESAPQHQLSNPPDPTKEATR